MNFSRLRQLYDRAKRLLRREPGDLKVDLVFTHAGTCEDLPTDPSIKLMIITNTQDYNTWAKDVKKILLVKDILQPEQSIIASLKSIPGHIKTWLKSQGVIVVDNVYPGSPGDSELATLVKSILVK